MDIDACTASAIALRPILAFAATRGVDTDTLLATLGVPRAALDDPDHRISEATHDRAWREGAARSGDDAFGLHVAEHANVGSYDVLDYALRYSPTLHEAFCRMSTFHRLICDALATTVDVEADSVHIRRSLVGHGSHAAECFFAFLVHRARDLAGPDLPIREVRFTHVEPPDVAPHAAFFRCPVSFGRAVAEIVFDAGGVSREIAGVPPGLARVLDRQMRDMLARLPDGDALMARVHRAVATTLHGSARPSLQSTARALKASPRTVQRWLGEHGTTHRDVVNAVRRDLAVRFLGVKRMSITEIAFLLGFSDVSGFRRTFKRWTGVTPSSFRAREA